MSEWTIRDTSRGNDRTADSRSEAESIKDDMLALGARPDNIEILSPDESPDEGGDTEVSGHNPRGSGGETTAVSRADGVREETLPGTDGSEGSTEDSSEASTEDSSDGPEFTTASPVAEHVSDGGDGEEIRSPAEVMEAEEPPAEEPEQEPEPKPEPEPEHEHETDGGSSTEESSDDESSDDESSDDESEIPYKSVPGGSDATEPADFGGGESTGVQNLGTASEPEPEPEPEPETALPESPPVDTDPVEWLPSHFVDSIQGVPVVNRKGYAVIASQYGISVTAEPVTLPSESGFEYAEFSATATTPDGREYSGHGSSHVDRGDDKTLLGALAETRAMKRAVAWASGVGLTAAAEMRGD